MLSRARACERDGSRGDAYRRKRGSDLLKTPTKTHINVEHMCNSSSSSSRGGERDLVVWSDGHLLRQFLLRRGGLFFSGGVHLRPPKRSFPNTYIHVLLLCSFITHTRTRTHTKISHVVAITRARTGRGVRVFLCDIRFPEPAEPGNTHAALCIRDECICDGVIFFSSPERRPPSSGFKLISKRSSDSPSSPVRAPPRPLLRNPSCRSRSYLLSRRESIKCN